MVLAYLREDFAFFAEHLREVASAEPKAKNFLIQLLTTRALSVLPFQESTLQCPRPEKDSHMGFLPLVGTELQTSFPLPHKHIKVFRLSAAFQKSGKIVSGQKPSLWDTWAVESVIHKSSPPSPIADKLRTQIQATHSSCLYLSCLF